MQFSRLALGLVAAAAVGMAAAPSFADVITTATGNGADTYLTNDSNSGPTVAHGTSGSMEIRQYTGVRTRIVYVRFDTSSITGPVSDATVSLEFTYANRSRTISVYGLNDGNAGENWDESTTSYSTAPGFLPASNGNFAIDSTAMTKLGTFSITQNAANSSGTSYSQPTVQTSDTTSLPLDSFLNSDTNHMVTLAFVYETSDSAAEYYLASKENGSGYAAPTLTYTASTPVPEPASLGLMGIGALAMLRRRRAAR